MTHIFPSPPQYTPPPEDPLVIAQEQTAQQEQTLALQDRLKGDTSSIMARFGVASALSGAASGSPLVGK